MRLDGIAVDAGGRFDFWHNDGGVMVVREPLEVGHRLVHRRLRRAVEDEAHRPLLGVLGHVHDDAPEVRVNDLRRGDQEFAAQRLHTPIVADPRRRDAAWRSARPTCWSC